MASNTNTNLAVTKMEFAVQMTCQKCVNAIKSSLEGVEGIEAFTVNLDNEQVIVETTLPTGKVQELIENSGRMAILRGLGTPGANVSNLGAAVAEMRCGSALGLARFVQVSEDICVIDGVVNGLMPGLHGLNIHELGDLSQGCQSTGNHYNPRNCKHGAPEDSERHVGDLGNILADKNGRAHFRMEERNVKVWDVIGRSLVVHSGEDDLGRGSNLLSKTNGNSGPGLTCGIIARSAGLFQNSKKFCACDGKILWEDNPSYVPTSPPSQL
ncbi:copper chaperone for superoxide dismutase-like [Montipora foliosa]|uniref:copper chaperone for superoxide dismutase-like n=1 Tax=Montipora foliosa TaxID=591990 RepID=UPI0035F18850